MSERDQFLRAFEREHAITRKVLHAFPKDQASFKPADKSSDAHRLGWTFIAEERMMLMALTGADILGSFGTSKPPETWDGILAAFDTQQEELMQALRAADDRAFDGTTRFMVGPKQPGDWRVGEFLWFLLHDQIHHRGQLSVYVRMTGGKVPSIYGPTADEPWS